jgi:hypothetical protein
MDNKSVTDALASNYLLARVHIRSWSGLRTDQEASAEIIASKGATSDSGKFRKKLLASADRELQDVHNAAASLRNFIRRRTLPWSVVAEGKQTSERLISTADSMNFVKDVAAEKREYDAAVVRLQGVWDQRVLEARANLGGLGRADDYPTSAQLPGFFGATVELKPLPVSMDFARLNIPAQLADALAQRYAAQAETQVRGAMGDLRVRLVESLTNVAKILDKKAVGEKTRITDALLENVTEVVQVAKSMNLTGSEKLDDVLAKIQHGVLSVPIGHLRTSQSAAASASTAAKAVLSELEIDDVFF